MTRWGCLFVWFLFYFVFVCLASLGFFQLCMMCAQSGCSCVRARMCTCVKVRVLGIAWLLLSAFNLIFSSFSRLAGFRASRNDFVSVSSFSVRA